MPQTVSANGELWPLEMTENLLQDHGSGHDNVRATGVDPKRSTSLFRRDGREALEQVGEHRRGKRSSIEFFDRKCSTATRGEEQSGGRPSNADDRRHFRETRCRNFGEIRCYIPAHGGELLIRRGIVADKAFGQENDSYREDRVSERPAVLADNDLDASAPQVGDDSRSKACECAGTQKRAFGFSASIEDTQG